MSQPKLEIYSIFLGAWLEVTDHTIEEVRAEAEKAEVFYKVNGVMKSWQDAI